jgi:predicted outer membrane protein
MTARSALLLAALAPLMLLAACDNGPQDPVTLDGLNGAQELQPFDGPMPTDPQGFTELLSTNDLYLVEAGKLAQASSRDPKVQALGALLVQFHTHKAGELKAIAEQAGATFDPQLSPYQQQELGKLRAAGGGFDKEFKEQMVVAHQEQMWLLQGFAANGKSPPLQAYAGMNSKTVEQHLGQVYALPDAD